MHWKSALDDSKKLIIEVPNYNTEARNWVKVNYGRIMGSERLQGLQDFTILIKIEVII